MTFFVDLSHCSHLPEDEALPLLEELLGEDRPDQRAAQMDSLLSRTLHPTGFPIQPLPRWTAPYTASDLLSLYASLPGLSFSEILFPVASRLEKDASLLFPVVEDLLLGRLSEASPKDALLLGSAWTSLPQRLRSALAGSLLGDLSLLVIRHQEIAPHEEVSVEHLQSLASSPSSVQDAYFTPLADRMGRELFFRDFAPMAPILSEEEYDTLLDLARRL